MQKDYQMSLRQATGGLLNEDFALIAERADTIAVF